MTGYIDFERLRAQVELSAAKQAVSPPFPRGVPRSRGMHAQMLKAVDVLSIEHGKFAYVQVVRSVIVGLLIGINALSPKSIKIVDASLAACTVPTRG